MYLFHHRAICSVWKLTHSQFCKIFDSEWAFPRSHLTGSWGGVVGALHSFPTSFWQQFSPAPSPPYPVCKLCLRYHGLRQCWCCLCCLGSKNGVKTPCRNSSTVYTHWANSELQTAPNPLLFDCFQQLTQSKLPATQMISLPTGADPFSQLFIKNHSLEVFLKHPSHDVTKRILSESHFTGEEMEAIKSWPVPEKAEINLIFLSSQGPQREQDWIFLHQEPVAILSACRTAKNNSRIFWLCFQCINHSTFQTLKLGPIFTSG